MGRPAGGPPPGMPAGGPPAGMPAGGPLPGVKLPPGTNPKGPPPALLQKIKPNYAAIRKNYLVVGLISAIVVCLLEVMMFVLYNMQPDTFGEIQTSVGAYLLLYNIVPTVIDFSALLAAWVIVRKCRNELVQNYAPIAAMIVICTVAASAHSVYSLTMAVLCLPIFMASIFGIRWMNYLTTGLCCVGLAIAIFFRTTNSSIPSDPALIPESIAAFVLLLVSGILALILIDLLNQQKGRLINATIEADASRKEAQDASMAKSDFLASMSHEIRTPLNAILGMTEVISRKSSEPEIREYASDVIQAGNALLALLADIIDISKIESGNVELLESSYELGSLINDSYNMVAIRIRDKNLSAKVVCSEDLPRLLYGDEFHLRQVIVNLLTNAVKYTDTGEIILRVSGTEEGDMLKLEVLVRDTGIGIKEESMPALFTKFTRLEDAKSRKIEGVGLGLSITKQLVELMGGTIDVESIYGVGSTFTVHVPQKIADRTPIGDIYSTYLDLHGEIQQYKESFVAPDAKILVVDDVPNNLEVIERLLSDTRVQVEKALSGEECLERVKGEGFDIILMDHMMPGMDGIETLKAMKEAGGHPNAGTPVIMLTANAMLNAREEYMEVGFVDYLSKPVRGARLERMILRYLPDEKVQLIEEAADLSSEGAPGVSHAQGSVEAPEASSGGPGDSVLTRVAMAVPEIDTRSGLEYCANDVGFYSSMLQDFAGSGRGEQLSSLLGAEDWENYRINVHALKSLARTVGLNALADESLALETAAKEGDIGFIRENHQALIDHFDSLSGAISGVLSSN